MVFDKGQPLSKDDGILTRRADHLFIKESPLHGRGVFTSIPIPRGKIIELAPLIVLNEHDSALIKESSLYAYYFLHGRRAEICVVGLGYASLYNHQYPANAKYKFRLSKSLMEFSAFRDIAAGEEITINYNGTPDDPSPVLFTV
ncbi:MAG TPA: SET domain-containing protein-lysine N-methyltransferase [Puia sp.]|nr:SET domain-containing protein-lysine N-methyltransferase [Puia sp.]